MSATRTPFSVDNLTPVAVVAQSMAKEVIIREDASVTNLQQYVVRAPLSSSPSIVRGPGEAHVFQASPSIRVFQPGDIVGYVMTSTGATTFNQWEN
jgi:hypothetical protein